MHLRDILRQDAGLAAKARRLQTDPDAPFPILTAKVKLTWRCNLRCRMCSLWTLPDARGESPCELPAATVADLLDSLAAQGLKKVHFSGGEVLLYAGFTHTVGHARKLGLQVNISTNGTLLDKDMARFLVRQRVHTVAVSIDAPDAGSHDRIRGRKGAWRAAWRGIEVLAARRRKKGRGPKIAVNTLVTRHSIGTLDRLYSLLSEHGIDSWRLLPIDTDDRKQRPTADQWTELARQWPQWRPMLARLPIDWSSERSAERAAKGKFAGVFYSRGPCRAPWFNLFVDADGAIYPCCMGKRDMQPYGNVLDTDVSRLLASERRREIRCSMAAGHVYPVCETCDDFLEENRALAELDEVPQPESR